MTTPPSTHALKSLTGSFFFASHDLFAFSLPRPWRAGGKGSVSACLAVAILVLFLLAPAASAAVSMESNGNVTSIGVPKGESPPDAGPPAPPGEVRDAAAYPGLPWGIVPEIHIPWPSSPRSGWQRPSFGNSPYQPPHGDGWQSPRRPGQRPPQTGK